MRTEVRSREASQAEVASAFIPESVAVLRWYQMRDPGPRAQGGGGRDAAWQPRLPYADRRAAGRQLAMRLDRYAGQPDLLVLGLPRGGVPVAYEVANELGAAFDVFGVRKLGVPGHEELALGAVASGGVRAINRSVVDSFGIPPAAIEAITAGALDQLEQRERLYREGTEPLSAAGKTVILVDDGLATGATMRAAIAALRSVAPKWIAVAVPVAPSDVCARVRLEADDVVCAAQPEPFSAVGLWYEDFTPVSTEEVRHLLRLSRSDTEDLPPRG